VAYSKNHLDRCNGDELRKWFDKGLSDVDIARKMGLNMTLVERKRCSMKLFREKPKYDIELIPMGTGGDIAFAEAIGDKRYEDVRLTRSAGPMPKPMRLPDMQSYTGSTGAMCAGKS